MALVKRKVERLRPGIKCSIYLEQYLSFVSDYHVFISPAVSKVKRPDLSPAAAL